MLALGYFSQMMLKDAQSLVSENSGHCTESEKEEEKSRHRVGNLKLLDF